MKVYDISQEIFTCTVYPGDPIPRKETLNAIEKGDMYNLSAFSMCAHNGTHIDTPNHFFADGKTVDRIPLSKLVGWAYVTEHEGIVTAEDAENIIKQAAVHNEQSAGRILIKGNAVVSEEAAEVFSGAGIDLIGNESQSVGPEEAPMAVHKILLAADVILLEGIRLKEVPTGVYLLNAAPLLLGGMEGAPCRAILVEF
ncbi:MAG: cyclase family protein [Clostridia bacterium]|nr:cyclase family protein [Clostridia bacterium]